MKKSMKIVTVLLAAMLSVSVFAACSNNEKTDSGNSTPSANVENSSSNAADNENEAVGTYKGQYTKFVGDSDDAKVTDEPFSLELESDGKGTHYRDDLEISITWELDGENFTMTESFMGMTTEYTGTLKDGKLSIFNGDPTNDFTCEYVYEKETEDNAQGNEVSASEPENYLDVSGVDFSSPSIVITYDDYDGMDELAKKMQNFELEQGTVVEIDGEIGLSMMSHTIVVPTSDHSQAIGTTFEVVGKDDSDYPTDGTRVHIVGVVRTNENYINVLVVPADQFKVSGSDSDDDNSDNGNNDTVTGETYDADTFTVTVPDGWVAVPNGGQLDLYKADSADNTFGANEITIKYQPSGEYYLITGVFDSYEEINPLTIGERTWEGVEGDYSSDKRLMSLNTKEGEGYISADIWLKNYDNTISVDDADVQAILSGITIK